MAEVNFSPDIRPRYDNRSTNVVQKQRRASTPEGNEIDLDDIADIVDGDEENDVSKRAWFALIRLLGPVLKRFGSRAWTFFKCVGWSPELVNCSNKVCLESKVSLISA